MLYLPKYKFPAKESGGCESEEEPAILFFVDGERLHQCMPDLTGSPGGNISISPTLQEVSKLLWFARRCVCPPPRPLITSGVIWCDIPYAY